jgi:hypothetical protein
MQLKEPVELPVTSCRSFYLFTSSRREFRWQPDTGIWLKLGIILILSGIVVFLLAWVFPERH